MNYRRRIVKSGMKIEHRYTHIFDMNITNLATVRIVEVMSDMFNLVGTCTIRNY